MKERTELAIAMIAICLTIAIILFAISTHYDLKNLNERLDREKSQRMFPNWLTLQKMANQAAIPRRTENILDVLKYDDETFDWLDKEIELKLDDPKALEEFIAEGLTLPEHNYPYKQEYQEGGVKK